MDHMLYINRQRQKIVFFTVLFKHSLELAAATATMPLLIDHKLLHLTSFSSHCPKLTTKVAVWLFFLDHLVSSGQAPEYRFLRTHLVTVTMQQSCVGVDAALGLSWHQ